MDTSNNTKELVLTEWKSESIFNCETCGNTFTKRDIKQHKRTIDRMETRKYDCKFCDNLYTSNQKLRKHIKNHQWWLGRDDFHFLLPSLFGLETRTMCYREKYVGLHGGSWGDALYPPHGTTLCGEKSLMTVKNDLDFFLNFLSSVTLTKSIQYFWNSFGRTKGLPGTQKGDEKLILVFLSISHPFWVSWSPLARPKQF